MPTTEYLWHNLQSQCLQYQISQYLPSLPCKISFRYFAITCCCLTLQWFSMDNVSGYLKKTIQTKSLMNPIASKTNANREQSIPVINTTTSLWRKANSFDCSYRQFQYQTRRFPALVLVHVLSSRFIGWLDCVPCNYILADKRGGRANCALFLRLTRENKFVFWQLVPVGTRQNLTRYTLYGAKALFSTKLFQ